MIRLQHTLLAFFVLALSFEASAGGNKRCGFGSKLFGASKSIISQVSENYTNRASSGGSSMSSGTSGCHHNGLLLIDGFAKTENLEKQLLYTNANYEELLFEMAAGSGDTLTAFAETFGCRGETVNAFKEMTKATYPQIIDHEEILPEDMLYNVLQSIHGDARLRERCDSV